MNWLKRIFNFYYSGFRNMDVGKSLWMIILIKLFLLFAVLRIFFFNDYLGKNFSNDEERGRHVAKELIK